MNLQDKSEPEIYDLFRDGTISEEKAREHIENFDLKHWFITGTEKFYDNHDSSELIKD